MVELYTTYSLSYLGYSTIIFENPAMKAMQMITTIMTIFD